MGVTVCYIICLKNNLCVIAFQILTNHGILAGTLECWNAGMLNGMEQ